MTVFEFIVGVSVRIVNPEWGEVRSTAVEDAMNGIPTFRSTRLFYLHQVFLCVPSVSSNLKISRMKAGSSMDVAAREVCAKSRFTRHASSSTSALFCTPSSEFTMRRQRSQPVYDNDDVYDMHYYDAREPRQQYEYDYNHQEDYDFEDIGLSFLCFSVILTLTSRRMFFSVTPRTP
jgi:hypothetical protein